MVRPCGRVSHPVPPPSVSPPTPGVRDVAGRHREAELLGGRVDLAEQRAAADAHEPVARVDHDVAHRPQVRHDRAVGDGLTGHAVAAAAHRERQILLAGGGDRRRDVFGRGARDQRGGAAVDGAVPDGASGVVARISGLDGVGKG